MRKFLLLTTVFFYVSFLNAQNVGIGTITPAYPLTVVNNGIGISQESTNGVIKIGFYTSGGAYVQTHTNTDMYFATNNSSPQMTLSTAGNIGIATTTPKFLLTFPDAVGDKISLWGGNTSASNPHYGFGIQAGLLQVFTNSSAGDIGFGYGSSGSFTQNILMKGDGNMNIGGAVWASASNNRVIRFGDGDFVHIGEVGQDDRMELKSGTGGFFFNGGRIGVNAVPDAAARLYINGALRITDATQGDNKILSSDPSGNASWKFPASYNSACEVVPAGIQSFPTNADTRAIFNFENYDDGNNFDDVTNYAYIAPVAGVYHFDVAILWNLTSAAAHYRIRLALGTSGNDFFNYFDIPPGTTGLYSTLLSTNLKLSVGEQVPLFVFQNSGFSQTTNAGYTMFKAYRVY